MSPRRTGGSIVRGGLSAAYRTARRIVVALIGGTVLAVGIVMIVGPGPATVVIPAGLAILGIEFAWARRWLRRLKDESKKAAARLARRGSGAVTRK